MKMACGHKMRIVYCKIKMFYAKKTCKKQVKARYESEKDAFAELVKKRNELRKEELMNAVINSDKSYEEILAFVRGEVVG